MVNFIRFLFSKKFVLNLLIAILFFVGIVYFSLEYLERYTLHGETIEVPDYRNQLWDDTLNQAYPDFELLISDSIFQDGAEKNLILEQDPAPATTVKKGRKIYITVSSSNPPTISMPELVDLSLRQATSLMEIYGLRVGKLSYRPDLCTNCILEQQINGKRVEAGERVKKGVKVDLLVGQGLSKEEVSVPYIIEFNAQMANELLKSRSLNIGSLNYDETVVTAEDSSKAVVYKQVPHYTEEPSIFMGSAIDLYLTIDTNRIVHSVKPTQAE